MTRWKWLINKRISKQQPILRAKNRIWSSSGSEENLSNDWKNWAMKWRKQGKLISTQYKMKNDQDIIIQNDIDELNRIKSIIMK